MALGLTTNKAWFDKAFVGIALKGSNDVEARAFTNSLSISGGSTDLDTLEVFSGKIAKPQAREDFEISFDAIPASTQDLDWIFHGTTSTANSITSFNSSAKHRVTLLWTDATGITAASMTIGTAGSFEAYRKSYAELLCTSLEYNMDAGEHLTATLSFKGATEDETGGQNYKIDTKTGGGVLSALSAYATGTKF
jgi:hypothetical protein